MAQDFMSPWCHVTSFPTADIALIQTIISSLRSSGVFVPEDAIQVCPEPSKNRAFRARENSICSYRIQKSIEKCEFLLVVVSQNKELDVPSGLIEIGIALGLNKQVLLIRRDREETDSIGAFLDHPNVTVIDSVISALEIMIPSIVHRYRFKRMQHLLMWLARNSETSSSITQSCMDALNASPFTQEEDFLSSEPEAELLSIDEVIKL